MKRSRLCLFGLVACSAAVGLLNDKDPATAHSYTPSTLVYFIACWLLLYGWARSDASERAVPYPSGAPLLVAFLFPIGIPVYLFRTRRWAVALLSTAAALSLALLCGLLSAGPTAIRQLFVS